MSISFDYEDLRQRFTFQQRPYITIAVVLDYFYRDLLNCYPQLKEGAAAPLDFTVLTTQPAGSESFRWIVGYSKKKFAYMFKNRSLFKEHADLIFQNSDQLRLDKFYKEVLEKENDFDKIEFLTAAFHLTYCFNVPTNGFNTGLIHTEHMKRIEQLRGSRLKHYNVYRAVMCRNEKLDRAGLPPLKIEDNELLIQVDDDFFERKYKPYQSFYRDWIYTVQAIPLDKGPLDYDYIYHLYFPIYDGVFATRSTLRGYLAAFFTEEKHRNTAEKYFKKKYRIICRDINDAYKTGTYHYILDNYDYYKKGGKPRTIEYWKRHLGRLHRWDGIKVREAGGEKPIYWIEDGSCNISIEKVLNRRVISNYVDRSFIDREKDTVLTLKVPSDLVKLIKNKKNNASDFLEKRIKESVNLLDDILQKRQLSKKEEMARRAHRKSSVASINARNMSHNFGSHVLANLSTKEDICKRVINTDTNIGIDKQTAKKIAVLNSFLRTRMGFLADYSISIPTVATSLKIYRDTLSYFKPAYIDRGVITWQELLLDLISGVEQLKSENIHIKTFKDGQPVQLNRPSFDLSFACPNGWLGAHALYIILENIIRNSAKHAYNPNQGKELVITVCINELPDHPELLEIIIHDNLENAGSGPGDKGENKPLLRYLNDKIEQSILNEHGALRSEAWGVLEMKICAAYLRRMPPEELDEKLVVPLLEAVEVGKNLGFKLYLQRPKTLFLIDQKKTLSNSEELKKHLKNNGVDLVDLAGFQKTVKQNIEHDFIVLVEPDPDVLETVTENITALPMRILTTERRNEKYPYISLAELESCLNIDTPDVERLMVTIWKTWVDYNTPNIRLLIRFDERYVVSKWSIDSISESSKAPQYVEQLDPAKKYIVYDRHGDIYKYNKRTLEELIRNGNILYYQQVEYNKPTYFVIDNARETPAEESENIKTAYKLIETGLIKIVILDERIQKILKNDPARQVFFEYMNIIIPPKMLIDLDDPKFYHQDLTEWLKINLKNAHFLIIHLGILEKQYNDEIKTDEIKARAIDDRLSSLKKEFPDLNIILMSGRGLSKAIFELGARFIHYSQIARYLVEEPSKYHLTKILFTARRAIK